MYSATEPISLRSDEKGIYFILVAIALVTILTLVGLGIDGSRLYINSLRQQRAADNASLAGAYQIGGGLNPAQIRQIAQDVAQDNFDQMGISYDSASLPNHFQISYNGGPGNEVGVITKTDSESFIMGKAVEGADFVEVAVSARATRTPLAVTLVLDVTGSMGEEVSDGNGGQITKLELLKNAAIRFANAFDPTRDRIAIVNYSYANLSQRQSGKNAFEVIYPIIPDKQVDFLNPSDTRNYDPSVIAQRINAMKAQGWTSIHGGLLAGFKETLRIRVANGEPKRKEVIVLVTDGAPNRDQRPDTNPTNRDGGLPSDLDFLPTGYTPPQQNGQPALTYPPYPTGCPNVPGVTNENPPQQFIDSYIEAILAADLIRQAGITLMTMAIGERDDNEDQDAFGTLGQHGTVKSTLMRRLANDAKGAQKAGDLDFPAVCADNFGQISSAAAGIALVSDDPLDFDNFLQEIANAILLRLTA